MSDKASKSTTKKEVKKSVYNKIAASLEEYKGDLKEKTFTRKLKKASKLFASDIARIIRKKKAGKQNNKPLAEQKPKKELA